MKMFEKVDLSKLEKSLENLNRFYAKIPQTEGCMKNIAIPKEEGGCGGWCCKVNNPSVLYVEFLNSWKGMMKNKTMEEILAIVEKALRNFLSDLFSKPCIFWNDSTYLCEQHETRPFACREYGIIPEEHFKPRLARLKVISEKRMGVNLRDQCNLVHISDDKKWSAKKSNKVWEDIIEIEKELGVEPNRINDSVFGSYKTYHDHLLYYLLPEQTMQDLSVVRQYGKKEDKEQTIEGIMSYLKSKLAGAVKVSNEQEKN